MFAGASGSELVSGREMIVFVGSWQHSGGILPARYHIGLFVDQCHGGICTSGTGQTIMGPLREPQYNSLTDAGWNERLAGVILVAGIFAIGVAPFWLNELLAPGVSGIMDHVIK